MRPVKGIFIAEFEQGEIDLFGVAAAWGSKVSSRSDAIAPIAKVNAATGSRSRSSAARVQQDRGSAGHSEVTNN
jgi:hypothetical protein